MTENIQPFEFQKSTNIQEHNDIVNKINDIIDGTNDNTDEIAIMKPQVNINTQGIAVLRADVDENTKQINLNTAQIGINTTDITAIENQIGGSFTGLDVNTDASTITMVFTKTDGSILSLPFPVVSTTQSGIMNSATYIGYIDLGNRVSALENRQSVYSVQFNSDTPSQADILTIYATTYPDAPNPPLNGTIVADYARTLQYTYDATITTWIDTSQQAIPIATNSTLGIVKGSSTDGQIEVEIDGTMSVVGYDRIITAITNLESDTIQTLTIVDAGESGITIQGKNSSLVSKSSVAIKNYSQATADTDNCVQTKGQIDADKTAIAGKLDKNAGIENAGKVATVNDNGDYEPANVVGVTKTSYATQSLAEFLANAMSLKVGDEILISGFYHTRYNNGKYITDLIFENVFLKCSNIESSNFMFTATGIKVIDYVGTIMSAKIEYSTNTIHFYCLDKEFEETDYDYIAKTNNDEIKNVTYIKF